MLDQLNPQQKEAVLHESGPMLVLAGAGTGKTKVLTSRIIYLINSFLASPYQILAVTFTNKAAFEMRKRIEEQIGQDAKNIWSSTFHSIASRILKRHTEIVNLKPDFTIIDSDDQMRLIKQIMLNENIDIKSHLPKNYLYHIERFKDKCITPERLTDESYYSHNLPNLAKIYQIYQSKLKSLNCVDFGDLLLYNIEIFNKSPETLEYYQNKFHYILVDEYQDTNFCQYQWLLKLAGTRQNICAVGDDDQSIYSWRGAEIKNILKFEKDFKGTKIIRLEQNYRSTFNILACASHLIKHNEERHKKTLWSDKEKGEKINLYSFIDEKSEAREITNIIDNLQGKVALKDIAILVRAGYQTRAFEEAFISKSLPYKIVGGLRFFERKEIKDIIAYLRVIFNLDDNLALQRIINLPKRGVGSVTLNKLNFEAQNTNSSLFITLKRAITSGLIKGKTQLSLRKFLEDVAKWQDLSSKIKLDDFVKTILEDSGYLQMCLSDKTPDGNSKVENIREFISSLEEFSSLENFLEHVSLVASNDNNLTNKDMVNVMTVHSAKGLEFDTVFIPGLEEGIFPSSRSIEERNGLEEERRLFYVAITRAKRSLKLSYAKNRVIFGSFQSCLASQFLAELPKDIIEQKSIEDFYYEDFPSRNSKRQDSNIPEINDNFLKERIFHQKFGYGKVISTNGDKLEIIFEKSGTKTVIKKFVTKIS